MARYSVNFISILVFGRILTIISGYPLVCPHLSHRKLRAEGLCGNSTIVSQYACLLNELSGSFNESCLEKPDYVRPGRKYVVSVHRKSVECSFGSYQPIKFHSKEHSSCIYKKTKCADIGQVLIYNGTPKTDVFCRCDYRKGYAFLNPPKEHCYWIPAEEDCSCYTKQCPNKKVLSKDYNCISQHESLIAVEINGATKACNQLQEWTSNLEMTFPVLHDISADVYKTDINRTTMKITVSIMIVIVPVMCLILWKYQYKFDKKDRFTCRFCGKFITDSSNFIRKKVNNAEVDSYRKKKGINLPEISSNIDSDIKYTIFTTREADLTVQTGFQCNIEHSWFKGYRFEVVTCSCTKTKIEGEEHKWKEIGWKYTKQSDNISQRFVKREDVFYGLLIDLILDDTDYVLCKTSGCHSKVAQGCNITSRPATKDAAKEPAYISYANRTSVLVQKIPMPKTDGSNKQHVTVLTFSTAKVLSTEGFNTEMSVFKDFEFSTVRCFICKEVLGWKYKPKKADIRRAPKFYALMKDKLIDASVAF